MILISSSCWVEQTRELVGHTTTTDSRSQRHEGQPKGRPDNNMSSQSQLIRIFGLPTFRAPDTPIPVC